MRFPTKPRAPGVTPERLRPVRDGTVTDLIRALPHPRDDITAGGARGSGERERDRKGGRYLGARARRIAKIKTSRASSSGPSTSVRRRRLCLALRLCIGRRGRRFATTRRPQCGRPRHSSRESTFHGVVHAAPPGSSFARALHSDVDKQYPCASANACVDELVTNVRQPSPARHAG
jgi:hypothetical protein